MQDRQECLSYINHFVGNRERGQRIGVSWSIGFAERSICCLQRLGPALISSKLDLSGSVRRQNFIETEVELVVIKFSHQGRKMNGAAVANARLVRNCSQWTYLHLVSGQAFDIEF